MARKIYPYSLKSPDAKIAGVCSTLGAKIGFDPTFLRIGFVALALFEGIQYALVIYAALGIALALWKRKQAVGNPRMTEFDRMAEPGKRKSSIHSMRTEFDVNDRRMMAIDHHLNSSNEELAREIEALREEK